MTEQVSWAEVKQKFKQVWGYDDFRPPQGEVIANLLNQKDSLVVLATGGGKSICFQLPALLKKGLTLVISPLLALMEDQVMDLRKRQLPAGTLHSALTPRDRRQVLANLQGLRLLYLSPETLLSEPVWQKLCDPDLEIVGMMLDEAHCLVHWGDTFRPAYRRLGAVRPALAQVKPKHPPIAIAAFTATANPTAQAELKSCLQLTDPQIVCTSPYRPHLSLNVAVAWSMADRKKRALQFIRAFPKQSGLVYMRSRREVEELAEWLKTEGFQAIGYHGGLPARERREIEKQWLSGAVPFVVTTNAFGMGVNMPTVRWVLHFHSPLTLADYIQEVGRGGRDGKPAVALMLVSEPTGLLDNTDRQRMEFFVKEEQKLQQRAKQIIPKLPQRGKYQEVIKIAEDVPIALGLLHSAKQLVWHSPFEYEITTTKPKLPETESRAIAEMQGFINSKDCRWAYLMRAFGFAQEALGLKCGRCDNCTKKQNW
ncbi:MAG: RecQ family ATP-dependent DNA helicase [Pseudanabaenaceae cyanobacterium]